MRTSSGSVRAIVIGPIFHDPALPSQYTGTRFDRRLQRLAPLIGIVETDWSPYTFTMNWLFTRGSTKIRFEKGELFCHLFPVERGSVERIEPKMMPLSKAPDIGREHKLWSDGRSTFNSNLRDDPQLRAAKERWEKSYFRGINPSGTATEATHREEGNLFSPYAE